MSDSRHRNHRRGVWQRRFWEHVVRDEADYERHSDYIHFNPIKHSHVRCAHERKWSSFHRMVRRNVYIPSWSCACNDGVTREPVATDWK